MAYGSVDSVSNGSAFATARRGGITQWEIERALELRPRHSIQSIARILGRPQEDVARLFGPPVIEQPRPKPVKKDSFSQPTVRFGFTDREARMFDAMEGGALLSDDAILKVVRSRTFVDSTYITTLIRKVRMKIEPDGLKIENVKGAGYRLSAESVAKLAADPTLGKGISRYTCGAEAMAILEAVAAEHGLTVEQITERTRARAKVHALQDAMSRLWATGRYNLTSIGRLLGRDHSTVSHGIATHRDRCGERLAA